MPLPVLLTRAICLAGLIFILGPDAVSAATEDKAKVDRAYLYEHPKVGYFIGIPVNVTLQDRGATKGIAIKSRRGYQVTVQTNPANGQFSLINMLSRLENKYLGKGRPWSRKLRQGSTTVAGLDAVEALYEGAGVRVRVIIVRGTRFDYVFIFLAAPLNF
ncbi:MAG TPA: hypothetical protein ENI69_06980, partial [Rhodospirillales bacterium]|nr:hypothetical protein [Rhodospirillales bacterium]